MMSDWLDFLKIFLRCFIYLLLIIIGIVAFLHFGFGF